MTLFPSKIFVWEDFVIAVTKKATTEKSYNKWSYSLRSINQYFLVFIISREMLLHSFTQTNEVFVNEFIMAFVISTITVKKHAINSSPGE